MSDRRRVQRGDGQGPLAGLDSLAQSLLDRSIPQDFTAAASALTLVSDQLLEAGLSLMPRRIAA